ncbi:MAG: cardiolipin synthase B [Betaproteobacteria bacterium RIFCSPLOWO2_12_FULL_67_28]|nr:MAG: cardiolipin synthase B [Betaproteobacteria bacterium RIFCSPLOWO2_02_FULL_68_150]OGA73168.1 MAG: cardiolipin synthase B [Betaproteobacteria bacterium RIFCSPLOWO2_12_FULL_67_28]
MPEYFSGNRLTLLRNGEQYFPELLRAIDAAVQEIFLETYIFADDETGSLVADALARTAARGVAVHLLLDGFGAREFAPRFRAMLQQAGVHLLVFRPNISPWTLRRNRLRRMHRKIACVDTAIAFVGGINIIDDFDTPNQTPPRYDYAVKIEGLLVGRVREVAARLWSRTAWATFGSRWPGFDRFPGRGARDPLGCAPCGENQRAALVIRDNVRHRRDIEEAYLALIAGARKEVLIANSYFFPGRRFRHALVQAAARGVRVTLLLQGRVEYALLHYASRALYGPFLDGGIEIHEYHRSFLHTKVAVFDGRQACVGSSNIDPFSLLLAREANIFVDDAGFAAELRASLLEAMQRGAQPVPPRQWKHKPLWLRVRIWLAYAIARLFIAFAGVDRYH